MSDQHPPSTTCAKCGRVVFSTDVDANGLCVYCAPQKPAKPEKPAKGER